METIATYIFFILVGAVIGALWARKTTAVEIWTEVHSGYIEKWKVDEYCKWMSRDFPVFQDAFCWLLWMDSDGEQAKTKDPIDIHRLKMKRKYFGDKGK
ncbi:MAG: hypothetical protein ACRBB4_01565 [Neptuniibacter sp.]